MIHIMTYNHENWPEFDKPEDDIYHNLWPFEYHLPHKLAWVWINLRIIYIITYDQLNIICHKVGLSLINLRMFYILHDNIWSFTYHWPQYLAWVWLIQEWSTSRHLTHLNIICHYVWPEFIYKWYTIYTLLNNNDPF